MTEFLTLDDVNVADQIVLMRADLDVPVQDGKVTDTTRLDRMLDTLRDLSAKKARLVLMGHSGRPEGRPDPKYSFRPMQTALQDLLGMDIHFAEDCIGAPAEEMIAALQPGDIGMLENLRFHTGEKKNDPEFAAQLAALADIYIDNAFTNAHRDHASMTGVPKLLPAYMGPQLAYEINSINKALENPKRPMSAIVGGAKVSTKMGVLLNLVTKVDKLILGGGMANTFLYATMHDVGASLCEKDMADEVKQILSKAEEEGCEILLQVDAVVASGLDDGEGAETVDIDAVPDDKMILDIGPETVAALKESLDHCETVVWNGPLGVFENPPFDAGTCALAEYVAEQTAAGKLLSVAGGGDIVAALSSVGVTDKFSYVSTGGGAFLELLEGKDLPAVKALRQSSAEDTSQAV